MKNLWIIAMVAASAWAGPPPAPETEAAKELKKVTARKADLIHGKERYQAVCASCHLENGAGLADGTFPQLAGQHPIVILKQLTDLRAGARDIPVMAPAVAKDKLTEQDMADIAGYLQLLPIPRDNGRGEGELLEDGQRLYKKDCMSCHGRSGEGDPKTRTPVLAGQHFKYMLRQAQEIRDGKRKNGNPAMMEFIKGYTDTQIVAVTDWMSRLVMPELPKKK